MNRRNLILGGLAVCWIGAIPALASPYEHLYNVKGHITDETLADIKRNLSEYLRIENVKHYSPYTYTYREYDIRIVDYRKFDTISLTNCWYEKTIQFMQLTFPQKDRPKHIMLTGNIKRIL